jgi:hypothetical protein
MFRNPGSCGKLSPLRKNYVLDHDDLGLIEVRVQAHFTGDPLMLELLNLLREDPRSDIYRMFASWTESKRQNTTVPIEQIPAKGSLRTQAKPPCLASELTLLSRCDIVSLVVTKPSVSIKELHQQTGEIVRASAQSVTPIAITERGKIIAYLAAPPLVSQKRPERILLPGYAAMMKNPPKSDVLKALDEDRGEY